MHTLESLDRLDFNDDGVFDEQVDAVPTVQLLFFVSNRQRHLSLDREPGAEQVEAEAGLVRLLEQARSELAMDTYRGTDDGFRQGVEFCRVHPASACKSHVNA